MTKYFLNLHLFDGEGGMGDGASAPTESQAATDTMGEGTEQAATANDTEMSFSDLIGKDGKYHADYEKSVQKIIDRRFGKAKANEEKLAKLEPMMATLASKYGLDSSDLDGLLSAVDSDSAMYEDKAMEMGLTVDQYRNMVKLQAENNKLKAERQETEAQQRSQQIYNGLMEQSEALKQKYPTFDLDSELMNPQFADLVRYGNVSLESAYIALHSNEILSGAMAYTAQEVSRKTADSIAARRGRPVEGGMSGQAAAAVKTDVSKLSKQDRARLAQRALRGEQGINFR